MSLLAKAFLLVLVLAGALQADSSSPHAGLEKVLFPSTPTEKPFSTDAVLIMKGDQVLYEKYWNGFTPEKPHVAWSVSKSISSLIVGTAVRDQKVRISDSICDLAPQYRGKFNCDLKLEHFLSWTSGLDFLESYEGQGDQQKSSVGQLLYGDGVHDSVSFVLSHSQAHPPGQSFNYSTGDSTVMLGILRHVYTPKEYSRLPFRNLFEPSGISKAVFERDVQGHYLGGSGVYITPRDLAKVGKLLLNQGRVGKRQLVSKKWVQYLTTPLTEDVAQTGQELFIPCHQWWKLNVNGLPDSVSAQLPRDIVAALGHWGQYLIVIPSRNLVIVRMGQDQIGSINFLAFLHEALKVAEPK